ncbi:hypothetical protein PVAP13_9KG340132 [Panicum virgatum]|uniref:Uncharacterized protein n=1 Tax=Panicum virgatum TaxID=38727 RepID=A0A8T0NMK4_PANVG|nr:hypothetical protein PVAP13_9KG340132 [Panicum virgatum]
MTAHQRTNTPARGTARVTSNSSPPGRPPRRPPAAASSSSYALPTHASATLPPRTQTRLLPSRRRRLPLRPPQTVALAARRRSACSSHPRCLQRPHVRLLPRWPPRRGPPPLPLPPNWASSNDGPPKN